MVEEGEYYGRRGRKYYGRRRVALSWKDGGNNLLLESRDVLTREPPKKLEDSAGELPRLPNGSVQTVCMKIFIRDSQY